MQAEVWQKGLFTHSSVTMIKITDSDNLGVISFKWMLLLLGSSLHPDSTDIDGCAVCCVQVCAACNESKLDCAGGVFKAVGAPTEASLKVGAGIDQHRVVVFNPDEASTMCPAIMADSSCATALGAAAA